MSDFMIEKLSNIDAATLVVLVIFIVVIISYIIPLFIKLKNYIVSKYKKEEKTNSSIQNIETLNGKMKQYEENRIHDREQSFKIQKELTDAIKDISDKLEEMRRTTEERFIENREREDKRLRAQLKDRIGQSYRAYHNAGKWTSMEKEALEDLIEEYEGAGGKNSFVHSTVQEEMYTWELVDKY